MSCKIQRKNYTERKINDMTVLAVVSPVRNPLLRFIFPHWPCLQQNCLSTPRTWSGRRFLLLQALTLQRTPLKLKQTESFRSCFKRETGKQNENQQLTTLGRDVGSKWTNQKTKNNTWLKFRIEMNQSNTCCVSWEVLLRSWKTNGALKIHKMAGPLKIKGRGSSVNSLIFSYP